jgi:hypothetical protein
MIKKILIRSLLGLLAVAVAAGLWWGWTQARNALDQVRKDRAELAETTRQRDVLLKERAARDARLAILEPQAAELESIRAALASGVVLNDLAVGLKAPGGVTAERLLALGATRLLIHGREDEEARRAFDQALDMMQWDSRLRAVCAAQAGLASAGRPIMPLADCKRLATLQAEAARIATQSKAKAEDKPAEAPDTTKPPPDAKPPAAKR